MSSSSTSRSAARERGRVARRHQPPARRVDDLRQADLVRGHDRDLHRQRLLDDDRHRVAVAVRRHHARHREHARRLEHVADLRRRARAGEPDAVADAVPLRSATRARRAAAPRRRSSTRVVAAAPRRRPGGRSPSSRPAGRCATTCRAVGCGARAAELARVDAHDDLVDRARSGASVAQVAHVVVAAAWWRTRRARSLRSRLRGVRKMSYACAVMRDRHAEQARRAAGPSSAGAGGEVHVHVLDAAPGELGARRRERAQMARLLGRAASAPRPRRSRAQRRGRARDEPRQRRRALAAGSRGRGTARRRRRPPRATRRLDVVAEPPQRAHLVDDEGLREHGVDVDEHGDPHRGPDPVGQSRQPIWNAASASASTPRSRRAGRRRAPRARALPASARASGRRGAKPGIALLQPARARARRATRWRSSARSVARLRWTHRACGRSASVQPASRRRKQRSASPPERMSSVKPPMRVERRAADRAVGGLRVGELRAGGASRPGSSASSASA